MSCNLTAGFTKGCKDNMGGIRKVWLTNKDGINEVTPAVGSTSPLDEGIITAITMAGSPAAVFYEFTPNKDSSNWVENIQSNVQNGTIAYEQVLTLMFAKNEATKRNQIKLLGQAELVAIVLDKNGLYWYLGEENGLELTGGSSASGTAMTDMNGWTLTLSGSERNPAREVDEDVIDTVI